ncbi:hypothetical protein [Ramlibacter sp. AN1133]|uniref:hypothetical protein n=1 Tax=Ramlibacter sp. AN1133 TaxID=3133429 RepID=UPI0030BB714E
MVTLGATTAETVIGAETAGPEALPASVDGEAVDGRPMSVTGSGPDRGDSVAGAATAAASAEEDCGDPAGQAMHAFHVSSPALSER